MTEWIDYSTSVATHKYMKNTYTHFRRSLARRVNWCVKSIGHIAVHTALIRGEAGLQEPVRWWSFPKISTLHERTGRERQGQVQAIAGVGE